MMRFLPLVGSFAGCHCRQHGVEAAVPLLGLPPVALDPLRHQVEHLRFEVHGPSLGVAAAADQTGVLEHLEVLGDGLQADVVRCREMADGGITGSQPSHHVASGRIGQGC